MNRIKIAGWAVIAGLTVLLTGVFGQFGLWWGLIATGLVTAAAAATMISVGEPGRESDPT